MSDQWRVKDAAGVVMVAPSLVWAGRSDGDWWFCEGTSIDYGGGNQFLAVAGWCRWRDVKAVAIAAPGALFASEQVAAETERCALVVRGNLPTREQLIRQWAALDLRRTTSEEMADRDLEQMDRASRKELEARIREGAPK